MAREEKIVNEMIKFNVSVFGSILKQESEITRGSQSTSLLSLEVLIFYPFKLGESKTE